MVVNSRLVAVLVVTSVATAHAERRPLSLADAIAIALAHNSDLYLAKADIELAADEIPLAESVFAPKLLSEVRLWSDRKPGDVASLESSHQAASGSLEINGKISSGLQYALTFGAQVEHSDDPFSTVYDPAYTTALGVSLTQPLMRGAGKANRAAIVVATRRRDVTEDQLRVRLEQIVGEVVLSYWSLQLAYKEIEARQSSLKLAEDQLSDSTRLVKLGTISDLDVIEARAGVDKQRQQLIQSQQALANAEAKLRLVIIGDPAWKDDDVIFPTDDPEIAPLTASIDEHMAIARKNRPDIVAARGAVKAEEAALVETTNGLLPQLDLIAQAGLFGLAGDIENNYATQSIVDGSLMPPYTLNPDFNGGIAKSFQNLATGGYYTVSVGLRLELPLRNTAAQAKHDRQRHTVVRAKVAEDKIIAQIGNEVRQSIALLRSDAELKTAADDAVADNDKLLKGMRKRFAGGLITSFEVLRVADELTRAQIEAARARASYRVSLARLAIADGTLLQQMNIRTSQLRAPK